MVAVQGLAGALPLDMQGESPGLNRDIDYGPIHFRANEVQRKIDKFWVHLVRAPAVD